MKFYHIATNEYLSADEIQERLDKYFDFKCNECKKSIGEHIATISVGIFCKDCRDNILKELKGVIRK